MEQNTALACLVDSCKLFKVWWVSIEGFPWQGKHHPGVWVPASHPRPQAQPHLPGLTASPARVRRHPQPPAARFLGQEGELTHSAADEGAQVNGRGLEHPAAAGQQQEKQSTHGHAAELHAEAEGREAEGWERQHSPGGKNR